MSAMNLSSARIGKRRAPQRPLPNTRQNPSVLLRRSSRIESKLRSVSTPHILGSCYESQGLLNERPTDLRTAQAVRATSYSRVPNSDPVEVLPTVLSRAQFQEHLGQPQTNNHPTQKWSLDKYIEVFAERLPISARLTKEKLKMFEKIEEQGRASGKDSKESKSKTLYFEAETKSSTTTEFSSKTVLTANPSSLPPFYANGIIRDPQAKPPQNLKLLQDRWNRRRGTPSPTEPEYKVAAYKIMVAENKETIAEETSKLLKDYGVTEYRRATSLRFNNFPKNYWSSKGSTFSAAQPAQPDMIEGLELQEFDPFPVPKEPGTAAIPYLSPNAITLPHLAGNWTGPGNDMSLPRLQAAYEGACMVYGRTIARSFLANPDPVSHASVVTFTTNGTSVCTFANYSSVKEGYIIHHQYPISSTFITTSYEDFKRGRRQLRNLQDYAKETSEKLRDELKENC